MATPSYSPNSASGESQDLGLFVQRKEAGGFDRLSQFPDFGQLARLKRPLAPYLRKGFELVMQMVAVSVVERVRSPNVHVCLSSDRGTAIFFGQAC